MSQEQLHIAEQGATHVAEFLILLIEYITLTAMIIDYLKTR
jgi:hypothetical protein